MASYGKNSVSTFNDYNKLDSITYNFYSIPRTTDSHGGGVAILVNSLFNCNLQTLPVPYYTSFEAMERSTKRY